MTSAWFVGVAAAGVAVAVREVLRLMHARRALARAGGDLVDAATGVASATAFDADWPVYHDVAERAGRAPGLVVLRLAPGQADASVRAAAQSARRADGLWRVEYDAIAVAAPSRSADELVSAARRLVEAVEADVHGGVLGVGLAAVPTDGPDGFELFDAAVGRLVPPSRLTPVSGN